MEALEAILGENAKELSANTIVRLKRQWEQEYKHWAHRDLANKRSVYFWADGIYFNVRLEDTENKRQCFLLIIGVLKNGTKELVGLMDGTLIRSHAQRSHTRTEACHRRWRIRLLVCHQRTIPRHKGTTLLGP